MIMHITDRKSPMRGRLVRSVWKHDPTLYAPPRYRRACSYESFIPHPIAEAAFDLPGEVVGAISESERSVAELNRSAGSELTALARLLLRTESIASSPICATSGASGCANRSTHAPTRPLGRSSMCYRRTRSSPYRWPSKQQAEPPRR